MNSGHKRRHTPPQEVRRAAPSTLPSLMADYERLLILKTLARNGFSRTLAAQALGVTRQHLWHRIKLLGIDVKAIPRQHPGRPRKKFT